MMSQMTNGINEIEYTFTTENTLLRRTKPAGLARSEKDDFSNISVMEFYNVFDANLLEKGKSYEVDIQAIDKKGNPVAGYTAIFRIDVE